MYKFLLIALFTSYNAFAQTKQIHLSFDIKNHNSDSVVIHNQSFKITLRGKDGKLSGSFDAPKGFYQLFDGAQFAILYLNNGFDLNINADGKKLRETITFSGVGAAENNYLLQKKVNDDKFKRGFGGTLPNDEQLKVILEKRLDEAKDILAEGVYEPEFVPAMIAEYQLENERIQSELVSVKTKVNGIAGLKSTVAPEFNFTNYKGGVTSLSSLQGKIVYIDVWATWCAPCRAEIPYLQRLEKELKGKEIAFVSVSIDEIKDIGKWKNFILTNKLGGTQLLADNAWKSEWVKLLKIEGIPRFIIIGKDGKIIDPDAPRPSSEILFGKLINIIKG